MLQEEKSTQPSGEKISAPREERRATGGHVHASALMRLAFDKSKMLIQIF
jgi:hypothetical protein